MDYEWPDVEPLLFQRVGRATYPAKKAGLLREDNFCLAEKIFGSRWDTGFCKAKQ